MLQVCIPKKHGYGITSFDKTNITFLLISWHVKILNRPKLFGNLEIQTWAVSMAHTLCTRNYSVYCNNTLCAIASSKWLMVNPKTHSMEPITEEVFNAYEPEEKHVFNTVTPKLKIPEKIDNSFEYKIKHRDIDTNLHVNNLKYIEIALEAMPDEYYSTTDFSEIIVNYKNECKYLDDIICKYSKISESEHLLSIQSKDLSKIHAIIKLIK